MHLGMYRQHHSYRFKHTNHLRRSPEPKQLISYEIRPTSKSRNAINGRTLFNHKAKKWPKDQII